MECKCLSVRCNTFTHRLSYLLRSHCASQTGAPCPSLSFVYAIPSLIGVVTVCSDHHSRSNRSAPLQ